MKLFRYVVYLVCLLFACLCYWAGWTNHGLKMLIGTTAAVVQGKFSVIRLEGSLARGAELGGLAYRWGNNVLTADLLEVKLLPAGLFYGELEMDYLRLQNVDLVLAGNTVAEEDTQAFPGFPAVSISSLVIDDFKVDLEKTGKSYQISSVTAGILYSNQGYHLNNLRISNNRLEIESSGTLRISRPFTISSNTGATIKYGNSDTLLISHLILSGDVHNLIAELHIHNITEGWIVVQARDLFNELTWNATIKFNELPAGLLQPGLPDISLGIDLALQGNLYSATGSGRISAFDRSPPGESSDIAAPVQNRFETGVEITMARPSAGETGAEMMLQWSDQQWKTSADEVTYQLPGGSVTVRHAGNKSYLTVAGAVLRDNIPYELEFDASIENNTYLTDNFRLRAHEGTLDLAGQFDANSRNIQVQGTWANAGWFFHGINDTVRSSGALQVTGSLDNYILELTQTINAGKIPPVAVATRLTGDPVSLVFTDTTITTLGGKLEVSGTVDWSERFSLKTQWTGRGFNPGSFWKGWPGSLESSGNLRLRRGKDGLSWSLERLNVDGELKKLPLQASLSAGSGESGSLMINLNGSYATAEATVEGTLGSQLALHWTLQAEDLSAVAPQLAGQVASQGKISGVASKAMIDTSLSAEDIITPWFEVDAIEAVINTGVSEYAPVSAEITLLKLSYQQVAVEKMGFNLNGTNANHEFLLQANSTAYDIKASGTGTRTGNDWTGELKHLALAGSGERWDLSETALLSYTPESYSIRPLCLQQNNSRLCFEGSLAGKTSRWGLSSRVENFPLAFFNSNLPEGLALGGALDADIQMTGMGKKPLTGEAWLDIPAGVLDINIRKDEITNIKLDDTRLELALAGDKLSGDGRIPGHGSIMKPLQTRFTIAGFENDTLEAEEMRIDGTLQGGISNISVVTAFFPQITDVEGSMNIDIQAGNTLAEPDYDGHLELTKAAFSSLDLGINVRNVHLTGSRPEENRFVLAGSMMSGEGTLEIESTLGAFTGPSPGADVIIGGNEFEIINLPELWALVNPQLSINIARDRQSISGRLTVAKAVLDLEEIGETTTLASDEIVVNDQVANEIKPVSREINLKIDLGDDITVTGKGITGKLTGELQLTNTEKGAIVADGLISIVDGNYSAYGQELTISEGRLIYRQAALDNPEVSITATRVVDSITVGLRVTGHPTAPDIRLFSSTSLPQEEILSYIVFGRSLKSLSSGEGTNLMAAAASLGLQNSGFITEKIASAFGLDQLTVSGGSTPESVSLVVGKYLNPKLYLSYGLGILDKISTARMRYDLSRRFSLEAERGSELGFDVFYKLDR